MEDYTQQELAKIDLESLRSAKPDLYFDAMAKRAVYESIFNIRRVAAGKFTQDTTESGLFDTMKSIYTLFVENAPSAKTDDGFRRFKRALELETWRIIEAFRKKPE